MSKITNDGLTRFGIGMIYSCTHVALIEQGLTSPPTQYRLYGQQWATGACVVTVWITAIRYIIPLPSWTIIPTATETISSTKDLTTVIRYCMACPWPT